MHHHVDERRKQPHRRKFVLDVALISFHELYGGFSHNTHCGLFRQRGSRAPRRNFCDLARNDALERAEDSDVEWLDDVARKVNQQNLAPLAALDGVEADVRRESIKNEKDGIGNRGRNAGGKVLDPIQENVSVDQALAAVMMEAPYNVQSSRFDLGTRMPGTMKRD